MLERHGEGTEALVRAAAKTNGRMRISVTIAAFARLESLDTGNPQRIDIPSYTGV